MAVHARNNARLAAQAEQDHAAKTSGAEIDGMEELLPGDTGSDTPNDRIIIGLGQLTEMLEQMPSPAELLGAETVARLKAGAADLWKGSLAMASFDVNRRQLAYEYNGQVIVRGMGRFMQSQARGVLSQAYYALRTAVREYGRWQLLDQSLRLARQTDYQHTRPGQAEDGVTEASWIDGDDGFDPSKRQADRFADALQEALPFVAAAYLFCSRVPGMTDDNPITSSVKKAKLTVAAERPQTMADRMRAAKPASGVGEFLDAQPAPAAPDAEAA